MRRSICPPGRVRRPSRKAGHRDCGPACYGHHRPASSGPHDAPSTDSDGTPPRPDRRDAAPAHLPDPTDGPLCRCPAADALDRPPLNHPVDPGAPARIEGEEPPKIAESDTMDQ